MAGGPRSGGGRGPSRVPGAAQLAVFPWRGQRGTKEDCLSCLCHYPDGDRGESGELGWRVRGTHPESPGVAMSHGHSHGGGGCRCAAEREEPPEQRGLAYGLYLRIDLERLQCLNESREGSGRGVFKPWEERTDRSKFVESDADEELLFNIPFTGNVKLKGVIIMGEDDDSHPSEMRLYKNIPQMSFDDTEREPEQTFSLNRDITGELEYATKISRFSNVYHLSIHISKNFGADTTKIFYIGLRGEWTELRRHEVTICNYEASANPADHRVHQVTPQTHFIS